MKSLFILEGKSSMMNPQGAQTSAQLIIKKQLNEIFNFRIMKPEEYFGKFQQDI